MLLTRVEVIASLALNLSSGLGSHFVLASLDSWEIECHILYISKKHLLSAYCLP